MTVTDSPESQVDTLAVASSDLLPRRFVLRIVNGNIAHADADCLVVNHYAGAQITGASVDVNEFVNDAIRHAAARGELDSPPGRITFVPARRSRMIADVVAILSMGEYEEFTKQDLNLPGTEKDIVGSLQNFGRSMAIACCDAEQRDVATVAHGAGKTSDIPPEEVAHHLLVGYWQGLQQSAKPGTAYTLILVELDPAKCLKLVEGVNRAVEQELKGDLRMRRAGTCADPTLVADSEEQVGYAWIGELDPEPPMPVLMPPDHMRLGAFRLNEEKLKLTVFGFGGADQAVWDDFQADIVQDAQERLRLFNQLVPPRLRRLEAEAESDDPDVKRQAKQDLETLKLQIELRVRSIGSTLYNQILNPNTASGIRVQLDRPLAQHLLLRLDERTVSIPWELMADEELFCLEREIGRQMELPAMVRNYMVSRSGHDGVLRVLLISNPTGELAEVEREAKRIVKRLHQRSKVTVEVTHLYGDAATPLAVLSRMNEVGYDVFHFAGHAYLDAAQPNQSGLVMAKGEVLTVEKISRIGFPPPLVFFNACETADTRLPIPAKFAAELREFNVLDKESDPLSKLGGNGTGGNGAGRNGAGSNGSGTKAVATTAGTVESEEMVSRFFGNLPASMVSTLLRAGITNFVGTTWPVEDATAAEFAVAFYDRLAAGESVGAAMREARKYVIQELGFGYLGWASYVLYGAPWNRIV